MVGRGKDFSGSESHRNSERAISSTASRILSEHAFTAIVLAVLQFSKLHN
jgi:hypothetical protein